METSLERVLPFLPPEMFFRSFAICSNNMRRTTFRVWIHDAVQHLAEKAANVTWPIMFSDLWAMDTHVDSAQAAAIYMYMFSQNAIDAENQSDAMLIKMARAACRTVVTRCVGREVGFHSMSNFNARLHEIFDEQFVIEDDQVFSKMFNAFRQDVRRFRIPNAFRSHQMARRRHPRQARNHIQVDTPDVHVHVSGRDEGEGEVQSSHSAADWLDQGFPAASGHVGGRDEGVATTSGPMTEFCVSFYYPRLFWYHREGVWRYKRVGQLWVSSWEEAVRSAELAGYPFQGMFCWIEEWEVAFC